MLRKARSREIDLKIQNRLYAKNMEHPHKWANDPAYRARRAALGVTRDNHRAFGVLPWEPATAISVPSLQIPKEL
eukprot:5288241-Prorocentrum_lima.AAC.1